MRIITSPVQHRLLGLKGPSIDPCLVPKMGLSGLIADPGESVRHDILPPLKSLAIMRTPFSKEIPASASLPALQGRFSMPLAGPQDFLSCA